MTDSKKSSDAPLPPERACAPSGVNGLDEILPGGFPREQLHLIEGDPGTGKTTLGLQFLLEGQRHGEPGMYVTFAETAAQLRRNARSHGWSLDGLTIHEMGAPVEALDPDAEYSFFHPSDVELNELTKAIFGTFSRVAPKRLVLDALAEVRLLAREPIRFRREVLAFKQFFGGAGCTVLFLDDRTSESGHNQLHSLADSVMILEQAIPGYGAHHRRLRVVKVRGVDFRSGYHDFAIRPGGLQGFPRLVAAEHRSHARPSAVDSGLPALDALLGEGLARGTNTLIIGPAGAGKSVIGTQYAVAAARRGERTAIYLFDERPPTYSARAAGLGMGLADALTGGRITLQQLDPAGLTPGQFAHVVRAAIRDGTQFVIVDSLNGYLQSAPEERQLLLHLHELLAFLGQSGVTTILTVAQRGVPGDTLNSPIDVTYLADTVLLLRYFEAGGAIRRALSVLKKRHGGHEATIRELWLDANGIHIGEPLSNFHGVLTGVPTADRRRT
jgi:circadian clock protein KaiC